MKTVLLLAALSVLVATAACTAFVPAMDIMGHSSDGSLVTIFGEHNFYQDTTSFGHPVTYVDGYFIIGGGHARNT